MRDYESARIRIAKVFGAEEAPEVGKISLMIYRSYLLQHLDKEVILTGREDFLWEEFYVFGPGDKGEYAKLKKKQASYTDEFKLIDIPEKNLEERDLIARVKRLSDRKVFNIGLSWLKGKEKKTNTYQLLDDFATWAVNW
jgi:hypothetical protein